MNKETFLLIWSQMYQWNINSKSQFDIGIDLSKHDKLLYNCVILLLLEQFTQTQIDFFLWSLFDDVREIVINDKTIKINTNEDCWEYINKLETKLENE
jgi:hypothetical protein